MADWLTPDDLGDDCCIQIPWKQGLIPHLTGAIQQMAYKTSWEIGGAATIEDVTQFILGALTNMSFNDGCDFEIRIDPTTGKIQYRRGNNAAWTDAQSSDGSDYTVVLGGDTIVNNLYKLPASDNGDKYCTAAWSLASTWSDDCQDFLEIVDALETITAEAFEAIADSLIGWIPVLSSIVAAVEFLHEGLTQPAIDYVRENCTDPDAISLAANAMFCAFNACIDNNDNLNNWHSYVEYPAYLLGRPIYSTVAGVPRWDDFKNVVELIFATLSGDAAGWMIVAWGGFITFASNELAGGLTVIEKAIGYASTTGIQRNEVDCGGCGECALYVPSDDRWEITQGVYLASGCNGGEGNSNGGSGIHEIWFNLPVPRNITDINFSSSNPLATVHTLIEIYQDETLVSTVLDFSGTGEVTCNSNMFPNINQEGNRVRFWNDVTAFSEFSDIEVCWS